MNYFKKIETVAIVVVILILGAAYGVLKSDVQAPTSEQAITNSDSTNESEMMIKTPSSESNNSQSSEQQVPATSQIRYSGQDSQTAMELLKLHYNVETQSFGGLGEFVKSIDGVEPGSTHFWAFYVNGQIAQVGADTFITSSVDEIEWKLERIE